MASKPDAIPAPVFPAPAPGAPARRPAPMPGDPAPRPDAAPAPPELRVSALDWRDAGAVETTVAWDALAQWASEPNPFFESWYLLPALRALDRRADVRLLRFNAGGDLAGVLPVARSRRYYGRPIPHLASWTHPNGFLGAPLVARGLEKPFWRALFAWADAAPGLGLFLHLSDLPLSGPLHDALMAVLAEQDRAHALVASEARAMLQSDLDPQAYLDAAMSGKKRKELRRQHNRLSELGTLAVERHSDTADLAQWTADFLRLEAAGWKGKAGSALACDEGTATLFRRSLEGAAARGRLDRLALTLDGRPIAMLASFLAPPMAFSFKTAFDEDFSRFSPGVLLQRENLDLLARPGITACDSCAAADHPMIDHIWRERRPVGHVSIAIGGRVRRGLFAMLSRFEKRGAQPGMTSGDDE